MHLLIVEDDETVREACAEIASSLGFAVEVAGSVSGARAALGHAPVDLILLDLKLPGGGPGAGGGLALLEEIRASHPHAVVVVMTAFATVHSAVETMRSGAGDYLIKPFNLDELTHVLERAATARAFNAEARSVRERLRAGKGPGTLIGHSPAMEKLYRIVSKVATTNHPVLLQGESGSGKELVARSVHLNGPHASRPFVPVDCGSPSPHLIESELFGYAKGAFPGAMRHHTGLLGAPEAGTVFLDDIADLPPELQAKLLRTLQERQVRPLGSSEPVPLTARILAASSRDLMALVEAGRFRRDLYFRLNVVTLRIPALRERRSDIPLLASDVLERLRRTGGVRYSFSDEALRTMTAYDWPGNVRELEQAVERACALSSGPVLHMADFPTQLQNHSLTAVAAGHAGPGCAGTNATPTGPVLPIAELERRAILNTLNQLKGDKLMAARLLGIGKTTLYRKLKEYGMAEDDLLG